MHRFLWLSVLMFVSCAPPTVGADELRFYYYPINAETLMPIMRENIRKAANCQGVVEEPSASALRAFAAQLLTPATSEFNEYGVRVLVEGTDIEIAMDKLRHLQVDVKSISTTYLLTDIQLHEFLEILKANPVAKRCIESIESDPLRPPSR